MSTDNEQTSSATAEESTNGKSTKSKTKKAKAPKKVKAAPAPRLKKMPTFRLSAKADSEKVRSKQGKALIKAMEKHADGTNTYTVDEIVKFAGSSFPTKQDNARAVITYFLNKYVEEGLAIAGADREVEVKARKAAA